MISQLKPRNSKFLDAWSKRRLALFLIATTTLHSLSARAADDRSEAREAGCSFTSEAKASLFIDPWAAPGKKITRFGLVQNGDESIIQNCRGTEGRFIALGLGINEPASSMSAANVFFSEANTKDRCKFTGDLAPLYPDRAETVRSRLKFLRSCLAFDVQSLNGKKIVLGQHPSCRWESLGSGAFRAHGDTCTIKASRDLAVSLRPVVESTCLGPELFQRRDLLSLDLDTHLRAVFANSAEAEELGTTIGVARHRFVFAAAPQLQPMRRQDELPDDDPRVRFSTLFDLTVQPVSVEVTNDRDFRGALTSTAYLWLGVFVQNQGQWFNEYQVPLASEAELAELGPNGNEGETIHYWLAYGSQQTLVPANWSGLFPYSRIAIPDFSFRNGRRYRVRMKHVNPFEVPRLLRAELTARRPNFAPNKSSYDIPKYPGLEGLDKPFSFPSFPVMGGSIQDAGPGAASDSSVLALSDRVRELGQDQLFPPRYERFRDVDITNAAYFAESIVDFTTHAVPGQVGIFQVSSIVARTRYLGSPNIRRFESKESARVQCL